MTMGATTKPTAAQHRFMTALADEGGVSDTAMQTVGDTRPVRACVAAGWVAQELRGDGTLRVKHRLLPAGYETIDRPVPPTCEADALIGAEVSARALLAHHRERDYTADEIRAAEAAVEQAVAARAAYTERTTIRAVCGAFDCSDRAVVVVTWTPPPGGRCGNAFCQVHADERTHLVAQWSPQVVPVAEGTYCLLADGQGTQVGMCRHCGHHIYLYRVLASREGNWWRSGEWDETGRCGDAEQRTGTVVRHEPATTAAERDAALAATVCGRSVPHPLSDCKGDRAARAAMEAGPVTLTATENGRNVVGVHPDLPAALRHAERFYGLPEDTRTVLAARGLVVHLGVRYAVELVTGPVTLPASADAEPVHYARDAREGDTACGEPVTALPGAVAHERADVTCADCANVLEVARLMRAGLTREQAQAQVRDIAEAYEIEQAEADDLDAAEAADAVTRMQALVDVETAARARYDEAVKAAQRAADEQADAWQALLAAGDARRQFAELAATLVHLHTGFGVDGKAICGKPVTEDTRTATSVDKATCPACRTAYDAYTADLGRELGKLARREAPYDQGIAGERGARA